MKIYINENYNIISIDKEPEKYFMMDENSIVYEESRFYKLSDSTLFLWKHIPQYEFVLDDKYNITKDENGNIIYKLDKDGNKILSGWSTRPSVDLDILDAIQMEYDRREQEKEELQLALVEQYENNLVLQNEITNTQIAIADIYESKGV